MTDILDGPLDGFAYEPGANAQLGRNYMAFCAIHYTAGACGGDRAVGLRGYFNVYIPREPTCGPGATCFAGVGRICYHACEWNVWGPGIEFEKADDSVALTQYQLDMGRSAIQQLIALGIAPTYTDTPDNRIPVGGAISGFVTHRSLHEAACDEHYDYLTADEMAYMLAPVPAPPPRKRSFDMYIARLGDRRFQVQNNYPVEISTTAGDQLIAGGCPPCDLTVPELNEMALEFELLHGFKPGEFAKTAKDAGLDLSIV